MGRRWWEYWLETTSLSQSCLIVTGHNGVRQRISRKKKRNAAGQGELFHAVSRSERRCLCHFWFREWTIPVANNLHSKIIIVKRRMLVCHSRWSLSSAETNAFADATRTRIIRKKMRGVSSGHGCTLETPHAFQERNWKPHNGVDARSTGSIAWGYCGDTGREICLKHVFPPEMLVLVYWRVGKCPTMLTSKAIEQWQLYMYGDMAKGWCTPQIPSCNMPYGQLRIEQPAKAQTLKTLNFFWELISENSLSQK